MRILCAAISALLTFIFAMLLRLYSGVVAMSGFCLGCLLTWGLASMVCYYATLNDEE